MYYVVYNINKTRKKFNKYGEGSGGYYVFFEGDKMERFTRPIVDFPTYSITMSGQVWNDKNGRLVLSRRNRYGTPIVMLARSEDGRQFARSVPMLVVKAWSDEEYRWPFTTVTHIDGDRSNCHIENLAMRPRYHAIAYHEQLKTPSVWTLNGRSIRVIETGEIFASVRECAIVYCALEVDIIRSSHSDRGFFPVHYHIEVLRNT